MGRMKERKKIVLYKSALVVERYTRWRCHTFFDSIALEIARGKKDTRKWLCRVLLALFFFFFFTHHFLCFFFFSFFFFSFLYHYASL